MNHCVGCELTNCNHGDCIDRNRESAQCVNWCGGEGQGCARKLCCDCRVSKCKKDWNNSCPGCLKTIAPHIVKENDRLMSENTRLVRENEMLTKRG